MICLINAPLGCFTFGLDMICEVFSKGKRSATECWGMSSRRGTTLSGFVLLYGNYYTTTYNIIEIGDILKLHLTVHEVIGKTEVSFAYSVLFSVRKICHQPVFYHPVFYLVKHPVTLIKQGHWLFLSYFFLVLHCVWFIPK